jgi:hypothetical protein
MKTAPIILGACFVVLCVASAVVLVAGRSTRDLQDANQRLQRELNAAEARLEVLQAEKTETANQLALAHGETEEFKARMAEIEAAKTTEAESEAGAPVVAPYQAQAFLGQKPLGRVWIIPQNLRKDTNSQRYVYEPVVWMDESLRKQFVTHHTNVVEREVESRTYVNSYYPQPAYYYTTPFWPPIVTNCPPVQPPPPAMPVRPAPQQFNPGSGTVTAQRLATPAGAIKTRPVP